MLDQRAALQGILADLVARYPPAPTDQDLARIAGHLAHGVAAAQSFRDGNRRTAYWATHRFLCANGLGHLMAYDDQMVARYLNQLVDDQGRGRPARVTVERFADLFLRRLRNRTPPST
ncbi:MAG: Fic family protein [Solirubrobacteraceae bacterium]